MATINMKLKPFQTPNFVSLDLPPRPRQAGFNAEPPTLPLKELDAEALSALCEDFRAEVFRKAGKVDPLK